MEVVMNDSRPDVRIDVVPRVAEFLSRTHRLFIGGEWRPPLAGGTAETLNPATGSTLSTYSWADELDVEQAVDSAAIGFETWSKLTPARREAQLHAFAAVVEDRKVELAQLESLDNGKPYANAFNVETAVASSQLRYFAGWPTKITGQTFDVSAPDFHAYTRRRPLGVCAAITPWNYSLVMAMQKIAPALAAGNSLILKPSELTPLTALYLAELSAEAGMPPGVLNVLTGDGGVVGAALSRHRGIAKVAFTGSTEVGREILRASASNIKYSSLELGGKSPFIIFPDADLEAASESAMWAIFANSGQNCVAGSRLFLHSSVYDEVLERVIVGARNLVIGNGMSTGTQLGPLISRAHLDRVMSYVDQGVAEGATLATGGERCGGDLADGNFMTPAVLTDVKDDSPLAREEIFGPVLCAFSFDSESEVIDRANHGDFGLAAAVWTDDLNQAHRASEALRAGVVWVNTYDWFDPAVPFGGTGVSGLGRELGPSAMDMYTELKSVWVHVDHP